MAPEDSRCTLVQHDCNRRATPQNRHNIPGHKIKIRGWRRTGHACVGQGTRVSDRARVCRTGHACVGQGTRVSDILRCTGRDSFMLDSVRKKEPPERNTENDRGIGEESI